jgi:hypothetical protein
MCTASEETYGFHMVKTVGQLHAEGCRWEMDHPVDFGIKATYGIDHWGAFFVIGRRPTGDIRQARVLCHRAWNDRPSFTRTDTGSTSTSMWWAKTTDLR